VVVVKVSLSEDFYRLLQDIERIPTVSPALQRSH